MRKRKKVFDVRFGKCLTHLALGLRYPDSADSADLLDLQRCN